MAKYASFGHIAIWTLVLACCFIESNMQDAPVSENECRNTASLSMQKINTQLEQDYTLISQRCHFENSNQEFIIMDVKLRNKADSTVKECRQLRIWLRPYKEDPIEITSYGTCRWSWLHPWTKTSAATTLNCSKCVRSSSHNGKQSVIDKK